jgi:hypothetical protein
MLELVSSDITFVFQGEADVIESFQQAVTLKVTYLERR